MVGFELQLVRSENRLLLVEKTEMAKRLEIYKSLQEDLEEQLRQADEKLKAYEEP